MKRETQTASLAETANCDARLQTPSKMQTWKKRLKSKAIDQPVNMLFFQRRAKWARLRLSPSVISCGHLGACQRRERISCQHSGVAEANRKHIQSASAEPFP